jgi:hypothetical protein
MSKIKIEEVALEAGASDKETLEKAKELGFNVRARNSTISEEQAVALIDYIIKGVKPAGFEKKEAPKKSKPAKAKESTKKPKETKETKETKDQRIPKMVKHINENLRKLNKQYNGVVEVDENTVSKNSPTFYKPLDIIGFNDFHAYGKQKAEFGENLDQAMNDLIMSFEEDKNLGIKVLDVRTEIKDDYSNRLKTYKIKLQHKSFGYTKPYTVSFHVPVPSKDKYLKIGGNEYIPINQFFAKPVIKVSPKRVRVYSHYSTCSIHLKHHIINDKDGINSMLQKMADILSNRKKIKNKPKILTNEDIEDIKNKYDLPETINKNIFVNLTIKS